MIAENDYSGTSGANCGWGGVSFCYAGHFHGQTEVALHSHGGVELVLVTAGQCEVRFDGGAVLTTGPGGLYVTPPGVAHRQRNTPDCETLYAVMELEPGRFHTGLRLVDTGEDALLRRWFEDLQELHLLCAHGTAAGLLAVIWSRLEMLEQRGPEEARLHPKLRRALGFIRRNISRPFSLSELARESGISLSYLNLLFRREFGVGPLAWISGCRMRRARQLLLDPSRNIAEIAELVGCTDANYFTRRFRQFHGVSPLEFRRKAASGNGVRTSRS